MIILSVLLIGFAFPTAFTYAAKQGDLQAISVEEEIAVEDDKTTIQEEPVAEAAIFKQNRMIYMTQITIIGLGIIMAGVGTYVFVIKNYNK